jgi:hypothetical protein|tara:strand:+ start:2636 stop:2821 length:186 start_codon:yes stop_codon:yes gene_type:complete
MTNELQEKFKEGWVNGQRKLALAILNSDIKSLGDLVDWAEQLKTISRGEEIIDATGMTTKL